MFNSARKNLRIALLAVHRNVKNFSLKRLTKVDNLVIVINGIKLLSRFSLVPFNWTSNGTSDNTTAGMLIPKPNQSLFKFCSLLCLRTLALQLKPLYQIQTNQISLSVGVIFFLWLAVFVAGSLLMIHPILKTEEFCLAFNAFVSFEKWHRIPPLTGRINAISSFHFFQTSCIPIVLPSVCWVAACAPQFIGSEFLSNSFEEKCDAGWKHKLLVYVFEVTCIFPVGGISAFYAVFAFYLTKSLNRYLQFMKKTQSPIKSSIDSNLSLPTPSSSSSSSSVILESSMFYQCQLYRQMQILLELYHDCFQMQLFPNMLVSSSIIIIGCLFAMIELRRELPLMIYLGFPFILFVTLSFLMVMLEMSSRVMTLSKSVKGQWSSSSQFGRSCWFRKFSRSCPLLKITAGPFNKIGRDRLAITLRFCLQRAIFFVVWSRRWRGLPINSD